MSTWNRERTKVLSRKNTQPDSIERPGGLEQTPSADGVQDQEKGKDHQGVRYNEEGHRINHNGHKVTPGIHPDGESGRAGVHPWHFLRICFRSSCTASKWTNVLWPFTIAAIVLYFGFREQAPLWVFITAYIGMVPAANLVGFAGQEMARKIPKVLGVILETTFGSIVEIILFMVLIAGGDGETNVPVIRAAILGSILANMLLCLGKSAIDRSNF